MAQSQAAGIVGKVAAKHRVHALDARLINESLNDAVKVCSLWCVFAWWKAARILLDGARPSAGMRRMSLNGVPPIPKSKTWGGAQPPQAPPPLSQPYLVMVLARMSIVLMLAGAQLPAHAS